jgi:hypothetical protein
MIISHKLNMIFIHVHRTGGTALTKLIKKEVADSVDFRSQHSNAKTVEPSFFEDYVHHYVFGFTRNPWDRILSWYSLIHSNDPRGIAEERIRLEEFIESDAASDFTTQLFHYNTIDYFKNRKDEIIADEIFVFENIKLDVKRILDRFKLDMSSYSVLNNTRVKDYKEYYTDKSVELVAKKCSADIQHFNYRF